MPPALHRPRRIHGLYAAAAVLALALLAHLGRRASPAVPPRIAAERLLDRLAAAVVARDADRLLRELPPDALGLTPDEARARVDPILRDPAWSELRLLRRELIPGVTGAPLVAHVEAALLPGGHAPLMDRLARSVALVALRLELVAIGDAWHVGAVSVMPLELAVRPAPSSVSASSAE